MVSYKRRKPDTEYTLKVTVSAKPGQEEDQWGAAVLINSIDENKNSVRIVNEYINENLNEETREITFTTRPDTAELSIGFSNRFPGYRSNLFMLQNFTKPMIYHLLNA
ncbi:MAG: hypothetical protein ACOX2A_00290 [Tepidanaerobacteraceae bacterium]